MINEKTKIELNGLRQTIHIKGNDINNPVLLFLHGGPGVTNRHSVILSNDDLLDEFTIVAWDQRGTAGSYKGAKAEDLTIKQMIEDANSLVNYLCARFKKEKIFVIGGSWGSLLGTWLLHEHPEKIYAFVGFGQVVNIHKNELISWKYSLDEASKANDTKSVETLNRIGPPVMGCYKGDDVFDSMMLQRNIMMKYGGYSKNEGKQDYFNAMVKPIVLSGEYSLSELIGYIKGYKFVLRNMWKEIGTTDFEKTCTKFKAPIFIFDGRLDYNTPSELVEHWFDMIEAPIKELHWFEKSGHNPLSDEPIKFKKLLKEKLLPLAKGEIC
ncbi:MAG: alpha/beta hydrolase [Erysipelotrichaceae bacterium]|nr:alpha/beta hydrolase [Erysipelotrichaceae bacterium]